MVDRMRPHSFAGVDGALSLFLEYVSVDAVLFVVSLFASVTHWAKSWLCRVPLGASPLFSFFHT